MQIYIHIPFCLAKCKYCAFNSIVTNAQIIQEYVEALCHEIKLSSNSNTISTLYFGGGTPSILTAEQFTDIFQSLHDNFNLSECSEITVEANPGTHLTHDYLKELSHLGVNRLSLGVQSFDDILLSTLGRIHNSNEAIEAINLAKSIFDNVSIDLMYDLPRQNLTILSDTIITALNLQPQHISIYGLEVEESTEFGRINKIGRLNLPNDDESDEMYEYIMSELPQHGFNRYEISNFAKVGFESKHNLGYWSDVPYLGFGAGAHSYNLSLRWSNISNVHEYIKRNFSDNASLHPFSLQSCQEIEEIVTEEHAMEEFCFLSLRKAEGIDKERFEKKFRVSIESIYSETINNLAQQGLIEITDKYIRLTNLGMKYGNYAFSEFLIDG